VLTHSPANPTAVQNLHHIFEKEGVFRDVGSHGSIRFMDVAEGAQPIFQLNEESNRQPDGEEIGGGRVIIGKSAEMLRVMRHARVAASSESTVLLRGENGTGKQLLAEMIALNSARREGPFITLETSSVPDMQLVSELFGHEKGAFTGARTRKAGAFEQAAGGTLFLDDVAGLSPLMQGKLFRALHDKRFTPVGGRETLDLDVRLIAGTNRDLAALMREGAFRQDLFYILNVIYIEIPPLRERKGDIPLLVDYFLAKHARAGRAPVKLPEEEMPTLMDYEWPGNVRELENLVERAVVMGSQSSLFIEELARLRKGRTKDARPAPASDAVTYPINMTLAELEKAHILSVLESVDHNQRQAAKLLGINPSTLWRKLKAYGEVEQGK
jgi:transcriptional regulator with PAS, ATPase and Fis domain